MSLFFFSPRKRTSLGRTVKPGRFFPTVEILEDRVVPTITLAPTQLTDPALGVVAAPSVSLRSAIQTINTSTSDTIAVINLASGTYLMQQPQQPGGAFDDNSNGDFTINPVTVTTITINGANGGGTII